MAVLIVGESACRICNKTIIKDENYISFPELIYEGNELDLFSDESFHLDCFFNHKMKGKVVKSLEKVNALRKEQAKI